MLSDANFLEMVWTLGSFIGAVLATGLCFDLAKDARDIRRAKSNGLRKNATHLCLAISGVFVTTMLMFTAIGVIAMTQPQRARASDGSLGTVTQYAVTVGFGLTAALMVGVCAYWRVVRFHARRAGLPATETTIAGGVLPTGGDESS